MPEMETEELINYLINYPSEQRYLEFKRPVSWAGDIRANITKSVMALANLRDGGWIIIGKEEQKDRSFEVVGLSEEQYDSFDPDEIKAFIYSHVEPPVTLEVFKRLKDNKRFVLLKINGFSEIPVICKKTYCGVINNGTIYVRSKGKPESIPIPTDAEMREIIENAIDKGIDSLVKRLHRTGIWAPKVQEQTADQEAEFTKQLEGLL